MTRALVVSLVVLVGTSITGLNGQEPSIITASTVGHSVVLHFTLPSEEQAYLEQVTRRCVTVEVLFSAELRKVRLLWPDARFATTLVRNRLTCDPANHRRALSRFVGGIQVATIDAPDEQNIVRFLATIGESPVFDALHYSPVSSEYSVRVRSRMIAPGGEYELRGDSVSVTLHR